MSTPTIKPLVFSKKGGVGRAIKFPLFWQAVRPCHQINEKLNPCAEWQFHPDRKFRFDYAWPSLSVALEIDGGVWMKRGGHTTGKGKSRDCEKDWLAVQHGWKVIRWTSDMVGVANCESLLKVLEKELLK